MVTSATLMRVDTCIKGAMTIKMILNRLEVACAMPVH